MNRILVIARHEFLVTITRTGYILAVVGMPLFFAGIFGISILTGRSAEKSSKAGAAIALIDRADVVDFSLAETLAQKTQASSGNLTTALKQKAPRLIPYQDLNQALYDLKQGRVSACYVMEADYLATGKITVYTPEGGLLPDPRSVGRGQIYDLLRASLLKGRIAGKTFERILDPGSLREMKVSEHGQIQPVRGEFDRVTRFLGPFGVFLLLIMAIFLSSGYLLRSTAEEKQNRVIEILLSSVKPTQLLAGKILGLGAAGLLQVVLYVTLLFVPSMTLFAVLKMTFGQILLSLVYFVLGYLLFASLMAGTGILGNSVQESSQLSALWTLTSMIPMFLLGSLIRAPDSLLARALSYFPLTAPVTMLLRIGASKVSLVDVLISIVTLIITIYLAVRGAAKVFRAASLMYGKRPNLPEILRWLREA